MDRMKSLKQIPHSWQPEVLMRQSPSKFSPRKRHLSGSGHRSEADARKKSPASRPLLARESEEGRRSRKLERSRFHEDRMEKLRDYFENVGLTPVKKIASGK